MGPGGAQIPHIVKHCGVNLPHSVSKMGQYGAKLPHILSVGYQGIALTLTTLMQFTMPRPQTSQARKLHSFKKSTCQPHFHTSFSVTILCLLSSSMFSASFLKQIMGLSGSLELGTKPFTKIIDKSKTTLMYASQPHQQQANKNMHTHTYIT